MSDLLHSFGCGIAFALGTAVGITIAVIAHASVGRKERKMLLNHYKRVEERLVQTVASHAASADALERIAQATARIEYKVKP